MSPSPSAGSSSSGARSRCCGASSRRRGAERMPAKRKAAGDARKRLKPAAEKRGLDAAQIVLAVDAAEVARLVAEVQAAGGAAIGAYREPLSGKPLLLAVLPLAAVEPTPFQRDLSPTHAKR